MRLEGKVALITGAASGMGLAMARRFAAEGARVVAGDVNAARLEEAVAGIRAEGGTAVGAPGDIADRARRRAWSTWPCPPTASSTSWSTTPG